MAELLKRGTTVDDRDSITGQTLLHFACKAGAKGIGDEQTAEKVVLELLEKGADGNAACAWTGMTPAHVAAYFGCDLALAALCAAGVKISEKCPEFDDATPLHLAAMAGSLACVKTLLHFNSDPLVRDRNHRTPLSAAKLVLSSRADAAPQDLNDVVNWLIDVEEKSQNLRSSTRPLSKVSGTATPSTPSRIPSVARGNAATPRTPSTQTRPATGASSSTRTPSQKIGGPVTPASKLLTPSGIARSVSAARSPATCVRKRELDAHLGWNALFTI